MADVLADAVAGPGPETAVGGGVAGSGPQVALAASTCGYLNRAV
jgi:hypothetical protein